MIDDDIPVDQLDFLGKVEEAEEGFGVRAEFNDDWEESSDFDVKGLDECEMGIVATRIEGEEEFAISAERPSLRERSTGSRS